jgi:ABC-type uncharacterized transport system permease subunit
VVDVGVLWPQIPEWLKDIFEAVETINSQLITPLCFVIIFLLICNVDWSLDVHTKNLSSKFWIYLVFSWHVFFYMRVKKGMGMDYS